MPAALAAARSAAKTIETHGLTKQIRITATNFRDS
jgi:hypothetical protein